MFAFLSDTLLQPKGANTWQINCRTFLRGTRARACEHSGNTSSTFSGLVSINLRIWQHWRPPKPPNSAADAQLPILTTTREEKGLDRGEARINRDIANKIILWSVIGILLIEAGFINSSTVAISSPDNFVVSLVSRVLFGEPVMSLYLSQRQCS